MKILIIKNYQSAIVDCLEDNLTEDSIDLLSLNDTDDVKEGWIKKLEVDGQTYDNVIIDARYNEEECLRSIFNGDVTHGDNGVFSSRLVDDIHYLMKIIKRVVLANMKLDNCKFFFLLKDDSFGYLDSNDSSPTYNEAVISMSKSLAKEYSRYNMYFNSLIIQPELKELNLNRQSKELLKNFALKYKSNSYLDVSNFIFSMIENNFPINGATIRLGNGVVDYV
ncbi:MULTISPECIES: hypothetical protein [Serratia]|uniref:hypothetical protein n=1 Tax=Serratia TaxID=613 RepID=UPI00062C819F|nr:MULTISPECIES: hypothetical protein [Serratia]KKZ20057.1 hypothetical protein AAY84_02160 [Serratia marcescens]MBE4972199.1 hypothetical protein [Serratia sp. X3]MCH6192520.1 hypothetical protein [Serratia sp. X10]MDI3196621.1 hypothetical protein [Serratia ureilytica]